MVERIDGAEGELNVALGIDVVEDFECDLADVLHVDVFIYHDNALGEHRLPQRPDGVHHFARLTGVRLLDRDQHQVVEDALDWQVDVHDLRDGELHQRQEDAFHSFTHPTVFHWRLADNRGGIDRIFAMRDAGDMKDRVLIFEGVEAGVIAEGALGAEFVEVDVAFEHDL